MNNLTPEELAQLQAAYDSFGLAGNAGVTARGPTTSPCDDRGREATSDPLTGEQLPALTASLQKILSKDGRPTIPTNDPKERAQKMTRRVQRTHGPRLAAFFASVLAAANSVHGLNMSLRDILHFMDEGKVLLEELKTTQLDRTLAEGARVLVRGTGRALAGPIVGVLAAPNKAGKVSSRDLAGIAGKSESHVKASRLTVEKNGLGLLSSLSKKPAGTRQPYPSSERVRSPLHARTFVHCAPSQRRENAPPLPPPPHTLDPHLYVLRWMSEQCPARSGDKMEVFWMTLDKSDFYHDIYRSPEAQRRIIELALEMDQDGALRKAAAARSNRWFRNVQTYIGA